MKKQPTSGQLTLILSIHAADTRRAERAARERFHQPPGYYLSSHERAAAARCVRDGFVVWVDAPCGSWNTTSYVALTERGQEIATSIMALDLPDFLKRVKPTKAQLYWLERFKKQSHHTGDRVSMKPFSALVMYGFAQWAESRDFFGLAINRTARGLAAAELLFPEPTP